MLTTFIRSIILYIVVLIVMRLMGKREIGQLQPFELAIAISNGLASNRIMVEEGVENANYNVQTKMGFTNNNIIISKVEN